MLDLLDSLVRKSLVTAGQAGGITRYSMLETIRQFAEDQLAAGGTITEVRDRHARWFAAQAVANLGDLGRSSPTGRARLGRRRVRQSPRRVPVGRGPGRRRQPRPRSRRHTMLGWGLQRFEPVGWAEELLPAATAADVAYLADASTLPPASACSRVAGTSASLRGTGRRVGSRSPL